MTMIKRVLPIATAAMVFAGTAMAQDTFVGLSSKQAPDDLQAQVERLLGQVVETLPPGRSMHFFDASDPALVATFTAPNGAGAGNLRAMGQANAAALAGLKRFMVSAEPDPGRIGHVQASAFLRFIAQNYAASAKGGRIILIGSPITDDALAPSVSMQNGRVPNDGHVGARVGQSIYATTGLTGSLANFDVFIGVIGEPWKVSEAHGYHVERIWALTSEALGASLAYFGDDLNTLFALAGREAADRQHPQPLVATDKLEMLQFAADTSAVADIFTQPLEVTPPPAPVWHAASSPRIGITWDEQDVDIDLYVRPNPSAEVIYFGNATTADGRLFKDFRNSPASGFETVELTGTVDLSEVDIALNYYGGSTPDGLSGEIRIAIGDTVWASAFSFDAKEGNRSDGVERAIREKEAPNGAWVSMEPGAVVTGQ